MSRSWGKLRPVTAQTRVSSYCTTPVLHIDTKHGHHGDQGPFSLLCEVAEAGSRSDKYESAVFLHADSLMVDLRAPRLPCFSRYSLLYLHFLRSQFS